MAEEKGKKNAPNELFVGGAPVSCRLSSTPGEKGPRRYQRFHAARRVPVRVEREKEACVDEKGPRTSYPAAFEQIAGAPN